MNAQPQTVGETLQRAEHAWKHWQEVPVRVRAAVLERAAELYETRAQALAVAMAEDMGKPITQGLGEVSSCVSILRYYARNADVLLQAEDLSQQTGRDAKVELLPLGVIFGIMPWNYPHYQLIRLIAPNLLLGNTVLFKHARICGKSASAIVELFRDAGAVIDAVQDSGFTHEEAREAIASRVVAGVSFTGGEAAGEKVAEAAGAALKKCVLELGGNDPFIVFDEHRLEELAELAATSRLANAGQTCVSPKRLIVRADLMDRFLQVFGREFLQVSPGDPLDASCRLGPLATAESANELRSLLREARAEGADIQGDLVELDRTGREMTPLMVVNPSTELDIWRQELFGPIAIIAAARDTEHAIALANDSQYGLGATVFADNVTDQTAFEAGLECGMLAINQLKGGDPAMPFGGIKRSGFGRELGSYGMREFANQRLVVGGV